MGVSINHDDSAATSAAAHCFPEPDLLVLELWASVRPPAWVDLMLEEFVALHIVSRPLLAMSTAPQDEEASLVDISSSAKAWTMGSPTLSLKQGQSPVMPQRAGHAVVGKVCSNSIPLGEDTAVPTLPP